MSNNVTEAIDKITSKILGEKVRSNDATEAIDRLTKAKGLKGAKRSNSIVEAIDQLAKTVE